MKNLEDTMKNLQKLTESLSHLEFDYTQPLKSIGNMQEVFDMSFWENMVKMAKSAETVKQNGSTDLDHDVEEVSMTKEEDEELDEGIFDIFHPNIDLFQTPNKIIVCCEAPGLERNSMEITLSNNRILMIKGSIRRPSYASYAIKQERYYGYFERVIKLPHLVTTDGMKSLYVNGLLELHFYKKNRKNASKEKITINFPY